MKNQDIQVSIPVGCVPPTFLVGGGLPTPYGQTPWKQTPPDADPSLDVGHPPALPRNRMTHTCKNITLP